jgi:hypothetical protein
VERRGGKREEEGGEGGRGGKGGRNKRKIIYMHVYGRTRRLIRKK